MRNLESNENKPPTMSVVLILWAALAFSQVIYVAVSFVLIPSRGAVSVSEGDMAELAATSQNALTWHPYALLALAMLFASYFIPKVILASVKNRMPKLDSIHLAAEVSVSTVLQATFTPFVIRIALVESISVFGLAASFTLRKPELCAYFTAVSLTGMAMNFPTERGLRGMLGI